MRSDRDLIGCVTVTGDGSQTRDFIHVHDAARAMECAAYGSPLRFWYDICTGQQVSIREVAECFDTQIMEVGERKIDVREILMDPTFAAEDLGFKYEIEPLVGIREYARD
jgi:nucleoside-diphosphate-sugar epimerase